MHGGSTVVEENERNESAAFSYPRQDQNMSKMTVHPDNESSGTVNNQSQLISRQQRMYNNIISNAIKNRNQRESVYGSRESKNRPVIASSNVQDNKLGSSETFDVHVTLGGGAGSSAV